MTASDPLVTSQEIDVKQVIMAKRLILNTHKMLGGYLEFRAFGSAGTAQVFRGDGESDHEIAEDIKALNAHYKGIYVGRALRQSTQGSINFVDTVGMASFDVDPIREKDTPSTESELNYAREAITTLKEIFLGSGYRVSTGNGYQLWLPVFREVDVRGRKQWFQRAMRNFERAHIAKVFEKRPDLIDKVKFDPQFDLPRIIRLPGTWNRKGTPTEDRPHRMAAFLDTPGNLRDGGIVDEEILAHAPEEPDAHHGNSFVPPAGGSVPDKFWELLGSGKDEKLLEAWRGIRRDLSDSSPSGQDCALASRLKLHGFSPDDAYTILRRAPSRGDGPKREDYYRITIEKVYEL